MPEVAWACSRKEELLLRHWPDGSVVFDDATAQLQYLSSIAGELLSVLMRKTRWTAEDLAQELLSEVPTADDVTMVENMLAEFSSLNLIERISD